MSGCWHRPVSIKGLAFDLGEKLSGIIDAGHENTSRVKFSRVKGFFLRRVVVDLPQPEPQGVVYQIFQIGIARPAQTLQLDGNILIGRQSSSRASRHGVVDDLMSTPPHTWGPASNGQPRTGEYRRRDFETTLTMLISTGRRGGRRSRWKTATGRSC